MVSNTRNLSTKELHFDQFSLPRGSATSILGRIISHTPELRIESFRREREEVITKAVVLQEAVERAVSKVVNIELGQSAGGIVGIFLPARVFSTVNSLCLPISAYSIGFFSNEKKYRYLPEEFLSPSGGIDVIVTLNNEAFAGTVGPMDALAFNSLFSRIFEIFPEKAYGPINEMLTSAAEWLTRMAEETDTPLSQSFEYVVDELIARLGEL